MNEVCDQAKLRQEVWNTIFGHGQAQAVSLEKSRCQSLMAKLFYTFTVCLPRNLPFLLLVQLRILSLAWTCFFLAVQSASGLASQMSASFGQTCQAFACPGSNFYYSCHGLHNWQSAIQKTQLWNSKKSYDSKFPYSTLIPFITIPDLYGWVCVFIPLKLCSLDKYSRSVRLNWEIQDFTFAKAKKCQFRLTNPTHLETLCHPLEKVDWTFSTSCWYILTNIEFWEINLKKINESPFHYWSRLVGRLTRGQSGVEINLFSHTHS